MRCSPFAETSGTTARGKLRPLGRSGGALRRQQIAELRMLDAEVVVDVANAPLWDDAAVLDFFQTSSRNILAAETSAGVKRHVVLSIVGADRLQESGYLRAKVAQEETVMTGSVPYTILRATQFFEFIRGIADSTCRDASSTYPSRDSRNRRTTSSR